MEKELSELSPIYVCRRENGFIEILAGSREIVVVSEHVDLSRRQQRQHEKKKCESH